MIVSSNSAEAGSREVVSDETTVLDGCCVFICVLFTSKALSMMCLFLGSPSTEADSFGCKAPESLRGRPVEETLDRRWLEEEALDRRLLIGSSIDALSTGLTVALSASAGSTACTIIWSGVVGSESAAGLLDGTAMGIRDGLPGRGKPLEGSGMLILRPSFAFFEGRTELPEKVCKMLA